MAYKHKCKVYEVLPKILLQQLGCICKSSIPSISYSLFLSCSLYCPTLPLAGVFLWVVNSSRNFSIITTIPTTHILTTSISFIMGIIIPDICRQTFPTLCQGTDLCLTLMLLWRYRWLLYNSTMAEQRLLVEYVNETATIIIMLITKIIRNILNCRYVQNVQI